MWTQVASLARWVGAGGRVAAVFLALFSAGCSGAPDDMRLVDRGAAAFVTGDFDAAEARLLEALEINADNGYALLSLGAVYERTEREAQARMVYAETLARFAGEEFSAMGVRATEREALAALARENLTRLKGETKRQRDATKASEMVKAVFVDLKSVTGNLDRLSKGLLGNSEKITEHLNAISKSMRESAQKSLGGSALSPVSSSQPALPQNGAAVSSLGPGIKVHLASYRSVQRANRGWEEVRKAHAKILGRFDHGLVRVDLGAGMGVYYRLLAGPMPNEPEAQQVCSSLRSQGRFCKLVFN